jgi:hypothetical protein
MEAAVSDLKQSIEWYEEGERDQDFLVHLAGLAIPRINELEAELAALKARLRWLFDNFAEIASPTEDWDEWCAEIDTHLSAREDSES